MSNRRLLSENTDASAPPKLRDVSSAYAKAFDKWQELSAELARLDALDPKHPDFFAKEFGPGDIDRLEPLRQQRIAELRGSARFDFKDGLVKQARHELDRLREEASRIICRKALPAYDSHVARIADAVRAALAAIEDHDAFLRPMEVDGVLIAPLVARGGPSGGLVRELKQFLRNHVKETKQ